MLMQLQVANPTNLSLPDSSQPFALAGKSGELIVSELHGKYFTQGYRGNVFIGSTAAGGVVPPIYNNTAQTFGLWNPAGSGKLISLIKFQASIVTVGVVTSNFCLGYVTNAGAQISTGSTISAGTPVAPVNANLGNPGTSIANFYPATVTTTAPSFLKTCGVSIFMAASPTAQNMFWQLTEYYEGDLIVGPGTAIFVANNVAGVATWDLSLVWEEVPV